MVPFDKLALGADQDRKQIHLATSANRSYLVFLAYSSKCTMYAKGTLVPPIRYGEVFWHICKDLQGFIRNFIVRKVTEKSENIWPTGFNLLKIKDNRRFSAKTRTQRSCKPMARQLHLLDIPGLKRSNAVT